ncbi:hypothetical protein [Psittacid alphaherpesvirus 1]|uniref:Uncharacterized protein ORFD n=1 Tax=Psittacid herpesvirus 1 (isolate Amazon parrot/-/97-0001/1997) TaxID=670426 RepID=ORFD_PSHV1|nr:protein ID [Psittacid alphaherpesvirus 1]Q6UDL2.1 RecName: Full=Uncharacterized protein ORFD [Psittacid herpesvirus 1 Amazon parrot/1997]AAQ73698.1 hypothetical protein [Psittacid alphaherpesvirus 1]
MSSAMGAVRPRRRQRRGIATTQLAAGRERRDEDDDAVKLRGEMVYVSSGTIAYSAWMFETIFGAGGSGAYSVAERPVMLTRVGEGLESCSCSYMGLTLYPVKTEQAGRMKRLAYRETLEPCVDCDAPGEQMAGGAVADEAYEDEDGADVCTIGVLENGTEAWPYHEVFFFPIVPTLDRWWPCVPSPALFLAIAKLATARLVARRRENGEPNGTTPSVHPLFYSTRVEAPPGSKELFLSTRELLGPLYDPLFDATEEDAGLLGIGTVVNANDFQAGVGLAFRPYDERSREEKQAVAAELRTLICGILDEDIGPGPCYVIVDRGPVRRRTSFYAAAGFKYTSVFEPAGSGKTKCHSVRLLNSALKPLL